MKRFIKLATLSALLLSPLSSHSAEPVTLRFSWWGGSDRHTVTLAAIEKFEEKNPDINIRAEYSGWDGYLSRMITQIAGGTESDIMQLNWAWLDIFSRTGTGFYDLSQLKGLDTGGYEEGGLSTTTRNDKLHAIPTSMTGYTLFYNAGTWQKAGLEFPETWQEFVNSGPVFKEKLGEGYYPVVLGTEALLYLTQSYMIQKYGKALIDQGARKIAYDDKQLEEFFAHYISLVEKGTTPSRRYLNGFGTGYETSQPWINGQWGGIMAPNGDFMASYMREDQTLVTGPHLKTENADESGLYYRPAQVFAIAKNSEHPEEAARFIDFLLHDHEALDILGDTRGIPYNTASTQWMLENNQLDTEGLQYQSFKLLDNLTYKTPVSSFIEDPQIKSLAEEIYEKIDYRGLTAAEAAKEFRRNADRTLRRVIRS